MNILDGEITAIKTSGNLSLVTISVKGILLKAIVIEGFQTASWLKTGNRIKAMFKETEVAIGKGLHHLVSMQNKLEGNITGIENGELLSKLTLDTSAGEIIAIITSDAATHLKLEVGERITAMIKTNEIMLST